MAGKKVTTGLVGLAVEMYPREKLLQLYKYTMRALSELPPTYEYRVKTETLTKHRQDLVNSTKNMELLEQKINAGQIEEVILQARAELQLARNMQKWKPWGSLDNSVPEGQWKWP